ncbi:lachesin-like [Stylophora pistillata]|uniref:Muscle, skeletal receptor tyrosine protein kinase n=1 Tax=Stylophora pistillata TaxID=50429 RepID=A0A2B4R567_STYPI|nr:lachesin-like [Stylophora pistillata]PFX11518.1 Muscle, skeletal receptor tyrosine protein kinase [Stylophora pistillata]
MMGCFRTFATLLFWIFMIVGKAELQPVWISSPLNPAFVIENENLDLHWRFNTDGSLAFAKFLLIGDDQSEKLIALKSSSNASVNVASAFRDRFIFNITNKQALVTLVAVQRSDSATYRFQIANQHLDEIDNDVNIRVLFPPSITSMQCPSAVTEGHSVKLLCNFTGNPLPSIVWNRANTRKTLSNREILFIEDIKRGDSSRYECLAWNGIGNNSTEFCEIDVNYPAQITDISINQTVQLGKNVTLCCRAVGNPVPTISWTHKNNVGSRSKLHVDSARFGDQGWYKCTAQNGIGSLATAGTYLDVAERASTLINVKMTITNEEYDTSLTDEESGRYQNLLERGIEAVGNLFRTDKNFKGVEILRFERGSVVVIFSLRFERTVDTDNIISVLKYAARDRKLGKFIIDPLSITALQDAIFPVTSSPKVSSSGI